MPCTARSDIYAVQLHKNVKGGLFLAVRLFSCPAARDVSLCIEFGKSFALLCFYLTKLMKLYGRTSFRSDFISAILFPAEIFRTVL